MSNHVNEHTILDAVKTILDADGTLDILLAVPSGGSKVVLGMMSPKLYSLPMIQLHFMTREINVETKVQMIMLRVAWFVEAKPDGTERTEVLADIGERVYDLLDDTVLSITGYHVDVLSAESGEGTAAETVEMERAAEHHYQSLIFRMNIRRAS